MTSCFDPTFTQNVIDAIGPAATPRTRQVMTSLIRHVHDFAREVELTIDEWMMGVEFLNAVGQISDSKRNEGQRISDVLGLESLVDEIAHKHISESKSFPTSSSILGPFYSPSAPLRPLGSSIIQSPHSGRVTLMHGRITDLVSGLGIANATLEIWQASSNGKYDFQDPENQSPNNLRGKFRTDDAGNYSLKCLKPTAYSLPTDGPAGTLLKLLDRHPMRPAHIHLMVTHAEYKPLTTQLFPSTDPYLKTDTVFAVKPDLVVDFKPRGERKLVEGELERGGSGHQNGAGSEQHNGNTEDGRGVPNGAEDGEEGDEAELDLEYNVILAPLDVEGASNVPLAPGPAPLPGSSETNGIGVNGVVDKNGGTGGVVVVKDGVVDSY